MKNNYIKLLFISFFIFLISPLNVNADDGYIIKKYDVDIKVNENNVLNVTETIDVDFYLSSHGIYRQIPTKNTYHRSEFDVTTNARIKNMDINEQYSMSDSGGKTNYKIGDPNQLVTGYKQYIIKYDYDIGDDNVDDYDDLYFNIIGTEWTTNIEDVTFKIEMPKDFDESLVSFSMGYYGNEFNGDVVYSIDNNIISGYVKKDSVTGYSLNAKEGLTLRIELEEGYFKGERKVFDPTKLIVYGLIIVFTLGIINGFKLFFKHSYWKKDLLVPEYTVPYDLTPSALGYLYYGTTKNDQIVSLIVYLANKGYLKIIEESKTKFSFEKLKDIDESEPDYVQTTFNGLFTGDKTIVKKSDLQDKFYVTLTKALMQLRKKYKIYESSHTTSGLFYVLMFFSPSLLRMLLPFTTYRLKYYYNVHLIIIIVLTVVATILGVIFLTNNKKRTKEANNYYNKARGFKDYIENVDKDKIETLVEENPNYFFDILPYAYVLGVTNKWSKKFESITMTPPDWYSGTMFDVSTGNFSTSTFTKSLTSTLNSTSTTMSSRPYESSGGGHSSSGGHGGGGFSGGGGGGGGGGRW